MRGEEGRGYEWRESGTADCTAMDCRWVREEDKKTV
jgi:hypothetical protein